MMRRPRPPPLTCKTPRPLTPKRCTETSAKSPAPDSLKLPPPYLAKLWQSNDQTTRQRPGAANRPTTDPTLPRCCHSTPDARRALVEVGRIVAGSGPPGRSCSACGPTPAVVAGTTGRWAGCGHRATTAAPSTAAITRFAATTTTPNRRYHGGLGNSTTALPPCCAPQCINKHRLARQRRANRSTSSLPPTPQPASSCLARPPGLASWADPSAQGIRSGGDRNPGRSRPGVAAMPYELLRPTRTSTCGSSTVGSRTLLLRPCLALGLVALQAVDGLGQLVQDVDDHDVQHPGSAAQGGQFAQLGDLLG